MLVIKKQDLEIFKEELGKKFPLFDMRNSYLSVKQYFLPGKEEIFIFNKSKKKTVASGSPKAFIIFGLSLRDSEALVQLDEIMKKPSEDYFYFQKRNAATIISIMEENHAIPHTGLDLILEKINDNQYKAHALSAKGKKITKSKFFKESETNQSRSVDLPAGPMPKLRKLLLDPELLKNAVEWSWRNYPEKWEELGKRCIGCGICTYVCPLCYCFSIEDRCHLDGKLCSKKRNWTACTLPEFAKISGHDFHPTLKKRYYNWFYHKFVRAYKEYGKSQCVACGRCQQQCPAKIDIEKELLEIVEKFKKNNSQNT